MHKLNKLFFITWLFLLGNTECFAADVRRGEELARRWCSACHLVAPDQKYAFGFVAPFATIAERSNFNTRELSVSLLTPHPQMRDRGLSRNEAADIAAYIKSLRK